MSLSRLNNVLPGLRSLRPGVPFIPVSSAVSFKRFLSINPDQEPMGEYEMKIYNILTESFKPRDLQVRDVSGGCGSMFAILVESEKFKGIPMVKQHRLVNEVLKDEIAKWHGLQLKTKAAK